MGIFGLESFMETECSQGFYSVDIVELAEKARRRSSKKPSMVVDLSCCQRIFYDNLDSVCGGQGFSFLHQLETFIKAVETAGINLIFVCDGRSPEWKREKRLENKAGNVLRVSRVFDDLENFVLPFDIASKLSDSNCDSKRKKDSNQIKPNFMISKLINGVLGKTITFSKGTEDADKVLAKIARDPELNVFAILSQDSDYLLYQLPAYVHYVSARHLDYERLYSDGHTLRTKEYGRFELANHLKLRVEQLPLFGALNGNDCLPRDRYDKFHRKLLGARDDGQRLDLFRVFYAVAAFIRDEWLTADPYISIQKLDEISIKIFGSTDNSLALRTILRDYFLLDTIDINANNPNIDQNANLVENDFVWSKVLRLFETNCSLLYEFLMMKPYESSVIYEDYRRSGIVPTFSVLYRKFRQRFFGVLFYEKPGALKEPERNEFVFKFPEYLIDGPNTITKVQMLDLVMPPKCHPGLCNLLEGTGKKMTQHKWKIFAHLICPRMTADDFKNLSKDYLYVVSQILIMQNDWKVPVLFKFEVELLLILQLKLLKMSKTERISQKLTTNLVAPRGVHIAALFTNGMLDHIQDLLPGIITKEEYLLGILHFDGVLFQSMYTQYVFEKSFQGIATKDELEHIKPYYNLVTSNGTLIRDNFSFIGTHHLTGSN